MAATPVDSAEAYPAAAASAGAGDAAWLNTANAVGAPDTSESDSQDLDSGGHANTKDLRLTDFDFNVPDNGTWVGLEATLTRRADVANRVTDLAVQLWNGSAQGDDQSAAGFFPNTLTAKVYGGAADRWNAAAAFPTLDLFNAAAFGVRLRAQDGDPQVSAVKALVDALKLKVYFTYNEIGSETSFTETQLSASLDQTVVLARAAQERRHYLKRILLDVTSGVSGTVLLTVKDDQAKNYSPALLLNANRPTDLRFDPPLFIDENRDLRLNLKLSEAQTITLSAARAWFDSLKVV